MFSRGNIKNKDDRRYCAGCRYFFGYYESEWGSLWKSN